MNGPLWVCEVMWEHRGSRNFSAQPHHTGWPQEGRRGLKGEIGRPKRAPPWGGGPGCTLILLAKAFQEWNPCPHRASAELSYPGPGSPLYPPWSLCLQD